MIEETIFKFELELIDQQGFAMRRRSREQIF